MKALGEDNEIVLEDACPQIGYMRVCGEKIYYNDPYETIHDYLLLLSQCSQTKYCAKGIPSSRNPVKVMLRSVEYFTHLFEQEILSHYEKSQVTIKLQLQELIKFLIKKPELIGYKLDIVNTYYGLTIGIQKDNFIVIPKYKKKKIKEDLIAGIDFFPLIYLLSYDIMKTARKIYMAIETPPPRSTENCISKGFRIECYKYTGSSACIYTDQLLCPLRILEKKTKTLQVGGATTWLKRSKRKLELLKNYLSTDHNRVDFYVTKFIVDYMSILVTGLSTALKKIVNTNYNEEYIELPDMSYINNINNPRLKRFLLSLNEYGRDIAQMSNPYQRKTLTLISLESFPYYLEKISHYILNHDNYAYCSRKRVSGRILQGYISRLYPFLKGIISEKVSQRITEYIEKDGCIEPEDLGEIVDVNLARQILYELSKRRLLMKVPGKNTVVFYPGPEIV